MKPNRVYGIQCSSPTWSSIKEEMRKKRVVSSADSSPQETGSETRVGSAPKKMKIDCLSVGVRAASSRLGQSLGPPLTAQSLTARPHRLASLLTTQEQIGTARPITQKCRLRPPSGDIVWVGLQLTVKRELYPSETYTLPICRRSLQPSVWRILAYPQRPCPPRYPVGRIRR